MFVSRPKRFYVNLARQRGLRLSSLLSIAVTEVNHNCENAEALLDFFSAQVYLKGIGHVCGNCWTTKIMSWRYLHAKRA
jgi:hypothetical protein